MKKKHLRALSAIENWLKKQELSTGNLEESFKNIRDVLNSIPEEETHDDTLPPPSEIAQDPSAIALYSDGGCRGNPGPGAFAYLIQNHSGEVLLHGVEFESKTTNNRMELSGPIEGLSELTTLLPQIGKDPRLSKVVVITDSKYVVEGMKSWVQGWKQRGWKKADNKVPENVELWQELDQLRERFLSVDWVWVKGHVGHPQNEFCDRKANEAMDLNLNG